MSRSRHLVDPELLPLLDLMGPAVEITPELLPLLRQATPPDLPWTPPPADALSVEVRTIPGPAGAPDIDVTIYRPTAAASKPRAGIFHIHGGGFVGGAPEHFATMTGPIAYEADCVLVGVKYRLAPETTFPGNIEDCYAGLAWMFANAADLGIDPGLIGVMGESAGGGLAAALTLLARDRGEYRLAFQHLTYPMLDDRTCVREPNPVSGEFVWIHANNRFGWTALLGHEPGRDGVSPYAAPARAEDLSGLPPLMLFTASLDLFIDENLDYARRLLRAGVPVELHVYNGTFHGFELAPGAEISAIARRDKTEALKRILTRLGA